MKTKSQGKLIGIFLPLMLLSLSASADNFYNHQYWQQQQIMQQRQIIQEMQSMRWAQERANREAQNQYWQQQRQQNIWHQWPQPQQQFYPIQPIRPFGQ